jgi:hypothetical protein
MCNLIIYYSLLVFWSEFVYLDMYSSIRER